MRTTIKGPEPASLTRQRHLPHSDHADDREKDDLRRALVTEQHEPACFLAFPLMALDLGYSRPSSRFRASSHSMYSFLRASSAGLG